MIRKNLISEKYFLLPGFRRIKPFLHISNYTKRIIQNVLYKMYN
jgi:hypothetical protein